MVFARLVNKHPIPPPRTLPPRYTATLAIGLVVFLAGMVVSYWMLPGLDPCPIDGGAAEITFDGIVGTPAGGVVAQGGAVAGEEGQFSARGLSAAAAAVASAAVGDVFPSEHNSTLGFSQEGLYGGGGHCFEGSNAVGSIRTILQVRSI